MKLLSRDATYAYKSRRKGAEYEEFSVHLESKALRLSCQGSLTYSSINFARKTADSGRTSKSRWSKFSLSYEVFDFAGTYQVMHTCVTVSMIRNYFHISAEIMFSTTVHSCGFFTYLYLSRILLEATAVPSIWVLPSSPPVATSSSQSPINFSGYPWNTIWSCYQDWGMISTPLSFGRSFNTIHRIHQPER